MVDVLAWLGTWLKNQEWLAIGLEGIALVAIFIWDRLDAKSEHFCVLWLDA